MTSNPIPPMPGTERQHEQMMRLKRLMDDGAEIKRSMDGLVFALRTFEKRLRALTEEVHKLRTDAMLANAQPESDVRQ